jgi:2-polyprenyl-3-methyl-5-hydroxy-6-metoxy-1,4-benzoquinol methylase
MKYNKENYITAGIQPRDWENHVNVHTLRENSDLIIGNVLDIGCNHGATTYWLTDYNINSITGIDINDNALDFARQTFKEIKIPHNFIKLDLTLEKLDQVFDTIICFHTLEHIYPEDVDVFLTNIKSMLAENGTFIIGLPYEHAYADPCHVGFYNQDTLNAVMEKNGFKTVKSFKDDRWYEINILTGIYK